MQVKVIHNNRKEEEVGERSEIIDITRCRDSFAPHILPQVTEQPTLNTIHLCLVHP